MSAKITETNSGKGKKAFTKISLLFIIACGLNYYAIQILSNYMASRARQLILLYIKTSTCDQSHFSTIDNIFLINLHKN